VLSLLTVPAGARLSTLDRLRCAPTRISSPALVEALARLKEIRALEMSNSTSPASHGGA